MRGLDDRAVHRAADPSDMLGIALSLSRQLREGWRLGHAAPLAPSRGRAAHLVIVGMGGSAIGGDLLLAAVPDAGLPACVVREGRLPSYIGPQSLVVASSYSGDTDETLEAATGALEAGATVLGVTSGGRLAALLEDRGQTVVRVPGGLPPRASLGYLLGPVLAVLERRQLCPPCGGEVEEAGQVLDALAAALGPDVPEEDNSAKRLAARFLDRIPVVYAASPEVEPAARRWKCQFNENSKTFAAWNVFPEAAHNEVVGWGAPEPIIALLEMVVLYSGRETDRARRLIAAARDAMPHPVHEVTGIGEGRLARLLSLVLIGDLTSVYLAYLRGVDPTPVEAIAALKQRLRP